MKACYTSEPFSAIGLRRRDFFPHQVIAVRKAYPDTLLQLARRGIEAARANLAKLWQINLYAREIADFPAELFTDSTVNWHRQQLGRPGLVAAAGLYVDGRDGYVTLLQSDLCQQVHRHPRLKQICASRINNRFRYWYKMLLNAVLDFAIERRLQNIFTPTAAQIVATTRKAIDGELFCEIYDYPGIRYRSQRERVGAAEYWKLTVKENADLIVRLESQVTYSTELTSTPAICVYHDIEEDVDTKVSAQECQAALVRMLEVEHARGVSVSYNILGTLFPRVAPMVAASGNHSIAFHTYDHRIDAMNQLKLVREVDLQVKGFRTARSVITSELSDHALCFYNFEWLMSSASSFGFDLPRLENAIVKIPAHIDDYALSTGAESYEHWMERVMEATRSRSFVAIGLHDCYSKYWIEAYPQLLDRLKALGELLTCDEILNRVFLRDSENTCE